MGFDLSKYDVACEIAQLSKLGPGKYTLFVSRVWDELAAEMGLTEPVCSVCKSTHHTKAQLVLYSLGIEEGTARWHQYVRERDAAWRERQRTWLNSP